MPRPYSLADPRNAWSNHALNVSQHLKNGLRREE
jgi:hypothetical protein